MRVAYFSFDSTNPFQERFYHSIANHGVSVTPLRYRSLLPLLQSSNFDILHLDWIHPFYKAGNLFSSCLKALIEEVDICLSRPTRIVWTAHNLYSHDSFLPQGMERAFIGRVCRHIDAIVGFSSAGLQRLNREFPFVKEKKQFVIPHGHYIDDYETPMDMEQARERLNLPQNSKIILYLGGMRDNKGVRDLVEAFVSIRDTERVFLVLAGGSETDRMRGFLDGIENTKGVILHRRTIPKDEIPIYFGAADIAALPFKEIFNSGSMILAVSMKKCIIIPDLSVLNEHIPKYARFNYRANDVTELSKTIVSALLHTDLKERGINASEEIRKNLSWDLIGAKVVGMYEELL